MIISRPQLEEDLMGNEIIAKRIGYLTIFISVALTYNKNLSKDLIRSLIYRICDNPDLFSYQWGIGNTVFYISSQDAMPYLLDEQPYNDFVLY